MAKKKSQKGKGTYATYKTENRALNNKIARLERRVRQNPNDKVAAAALKRAQAGKMNMRTASNTKGNYPSAKTFTYDSAGKTGLMPDFTPDFLKREGR